MITSSLKPRRPTDSFPRGKQSAAALRPAYFDHLVALGYLPAQLRTAYGVASISLGGVTGTGAGQTIAVIDAYNDPSFVDSTAANFDTSDLHNFDVAAGLPDPPSFIKLNQTGGTTLPANDTEGWATEEALDIEWAHAMAPMANIVAIEANSGEDSANRFPIWRRQSTPPGTCRGSR